MTGTVEYLITVAPNEGFDVWNLVTGSSVRSMNAKVGGQVALIDANHVVCSQSEKALLQIYSYKTGQAASKCPVAEKMTVFATNEDGSFFAAAADTGNVYVWDLADGSLLAEFKAHYKGVSALAFTWDSEFLVTGGKDSSICVWSMAQVLDALRTSRPSPVFQFSDHALPVTGLYCTHGPGMSTSIVSSSLDRTCRIFSLSNRSMIQSYTFPCGINDVLLNASQDMLFAAGSDGTIHAVNLKTQQRSMFVGHSKAVTSLALAFADTKLLSGSEDGQAIVWDIRSKQALKTLAKGQQRHCVSKILVVQDMLALLEAASSSTTSAKSLLQEHQGSSKVQKQRARGGARCITLNKYVRQGQDAASNTEDSALQLLGGSMTSVRVGGAGSIAPWKDSEQGMRMLHAQNAWIHEAVEVEYMADPVVQVHELQARVQSLQQETRELRTKNQELYQYCVEAGMRE